MDSEKTIKEGVYNIPSTHRAYAKDGKLYVVAKKIKPQIERCRDCKHFGYGYSRYTQHYQRPVCFHRPKNKALFYGTLESRKACENFEPKKLNS